MLRTPPWPLCHGRGESKAVSTEDQPELVVEAIRQVVESVTFKGRR
jgi:hypothetical protein